KGREANPGEKPQTRRLAWSAQFSPPNSSPNNLGSQESREGKVGANRPNPQPSTPAPGFKPRAGFAVKVRPPCGQNLSFNSPAPNSSPPHSSPPRPTRSEEC